jgi:hypothetical protein
VGFDQLIPQKSQKKKSLHLFPREDQSLLLWWDTLLLLNSLLDSVHFISWLNINFDFLASQCLKRKNPKKE